MKIVLAIVLVNIAIAFAGRLPLPVDPPTSRIIGGTQATNGQRPYQILLRRNGAFTCGGSFIGTRTVLTAAHCVDGNENNPKVFTISYNTLTQSGGQTIQVSKVVKHSSYNSQTIDYDYAILHLATAMSPGTNAAVGTLVADGQDPAGGTSVVISGWGRTSGSSQAVSQNLLVATLSIVARSTCSTRWGRTIPARGICAHSTSKSACNGDSGGPMTCGTQICGVASYVGSTSCLHQTLPNVYARVGAVRSWIDSNSIG